MESNSGVSLERLESRVLMAVDVDLSDKGKLRIIAPDGDTAGDLIELTVINDKKNVQVWVNGTHVQTWSFTDPNPGVREVAVTLGAGENTIRLTHPSSASPAIDRIEIASP